MKEEDVYISKDKSKLDTELIYKFLSKSYWANNRTKQQVEKSIDNSICFGIYNSNYQIGFARIITDQTTFAYICDVFILEQHRKKGNAQKLMKAILSDNLFVEIKRWYLITKDAQSLYKKFGFVEHTNPEKILMSIPN